MTGILKTQTISNPAGTKSVEIDYVLDGTAKASYTITETTTTALLKSLNCSGVVDNGTGNSTVSFTNSFTDADFTMGGMNADWAAGAGVYAMQVSARTASSIQTITRTYTGGVSDNIRASMVILGDLA